MGWASRTYGRQERYLQGVWCGDLSEEDNLEDLEVEERIVLDRWRAAVNKEMKFSLKSYECSWIFGEMLLLKKDYASWSFFVT